MGNIYFKVYEERCKKIIDNFHSTINLIEEQKVAHILNEAKEEIADLESKMKLEIAFIGQYSAGKSTIISALTKNNDIKIGQDITTAHPQPYQWGNVLLVDTPGILAGNEEHDSLSLRYMDKADLLVYVITVNGFDDIIGKNFRKLAFEQNRFPRMILLMNKLSTETSLNKANWEESIKPVIEPLTPKEIGFICIDAQDYIDGSYEIDTLDGKELIELSNFNEFHKQLDIFINEKGLMGRIIAPLNMVQTYSNQIINQLTSDTEEVSKLQELIRQKQFIVKESRKRLEQKVFSEVHRLSTTITKKGHELVSLITPSIEQEVLESKSDEINMEIDKLFFETSIKIDDLIEEELSILLNEINELMESQLAEDLRETLNISFDYQVDVKDKRLNEKAKKAPEVLQRVGGLLNIVGKNFKDWTVNSQKVGETGLKAIAGGDAHKGILEIGHFFGKKFKPYEAQKMALKLGKFGENAVKVGRVMGAAQIIIAPALAIYEENQEVKYAENLKKTRLEARDKFNEMSKSVKENYINHLESVLNNVHDKELENISINSKELRNTELAKSDYVKELELIINECDVLIKKAN